MTEPTTASPPETTERRKDTGPVSYRSCRPPVVPGPEHAPSSRRPFGIDAGESKRGTSALSAPIA
jgi:hypothetical protein